MIFVTEEIFTSSKSICSQLLLISQKQLTGRLDLQNKKGAQWNLYFNLGRLVWATADNQPHRRWQRLMCRYCPEVNWQQVDCRISCGSSQEFECWDYQLVNILFEQKLISLDQVLAVIKANVVEVMFDIFQTLDGQSSVNANSLKSESLPSLWQLNGGAKRGATLQSQWQAKARPSHSVILPPFCLLEVQPIIKQTFQEWEDWIRAGLISFSPNLAPVLKDRAKLQQQTGSKTYKYLLKLINGKRSLRDITLHTKSRNLLQLTTFLLPYLSEGLIELMPIADIRVRASRNANHAHDGALIVCIDNNPAVCHLIKQVVEACGYRFLAIKDEVKAVSSLLKNQPDLVFVNPTMPIVNGYEICSQIRRIPSLKKVPIVMITDHDNIVDRVRAKMTGVTSFLSKPLNSQKVKTILYHYHLKPSLNNHNLEMIAPTSKLVQKQPKYLMISA